MESFEKNGRMYKTSSTTDGYSALEFFTKLNPECEALFQYPKRNWHPSDRIWLENRPLGKNRLAETMKDIRKDAALARVYTNHSVRATAITLWANSGLLRFPIERGARQVSRPSFTVKTLMLSLVTALVSIGDILQY